MPPHRWTQFLEDARAFYSSGFADQARALGWTDADLFGFDDARLFAPIDSSGLVWLLSGNKLIALSARTATIETRTGERQTWRRKPTEPHRMPAWEPTR
jgi:hypothetical protein